MDAKEISKKEIWSLLVAKGVLDIMTCFQILTPPLALCVALYKLLKLPEPRLFLYEIRMIMLSSWVAVRLK